jgi:hypothetical protein
VKSDSGLQLLKSSISCTSRTWRSQRVQLMSVATIWPPCSCQGRASNIALALQPGQISSMARGKTVGKPGLDTGVRNLMHGALPQVTQLASAYFNRMFPCAGSEPFLL